MITLAGLLQGLEQARLFDPKTLCRDDIPGDTGVYIWFYKTEKGCAYVGKAGNKNGGLRKRIWDQHLRAGYLERRSSCVHNPANWFQRLHAIVKDDWPHIDKSALRVNIGRLHHLSPGQPTVEFIRENLKVTWIVLSASEVRAAEKLLRAHFQANGGVRYGIEGNRAQWLRALQGRPLDSPLSVLRQ